MGDDRADETSFENLQNEIKSDLKKARTEGDLKALEPKIRELQALFIKRFSLATNPHITTTQPGTTSDADSPKQ
jgi:hypothetical protein